MIILNNKNNNFKVEVKKIIRDAQVKLIFVEKVFYEII